MASRERIGLNVGRAIPVAVSLVGRGDDDARHRIGSAARLEHDPGAEHVVLEGFYRFLIRDTDLRLGSEMDDDLGLMVGERRLDGRAVTDVAVHAHHRLVRCEDRPAGPVDIEPYDLGAGSDEIPRQPTAEESSGSCDEDRPPLPGIYCHVTQGALPASHIARSVRSSRSVSTHCQKASCL